MSMVFTKVESGIYKSENGYTIKKHTPMIIFKGNPMSSRETRWYIYNSDNEKVDYAFTLKEAKTIIEKM